MWGPMPVLCDAERLVQVEFEVLCSGLGRLAAVDPRDVLNFPSESSDLHL